MRSRDAVLEDLRAGRVPKVLIVGAGINGVGVFWDLALQGVPALMIDKGDISSGASAAPSRLIHGGIRYLEIGEFALVKESVTERNRLLIGAPHYVRPLRVWVPIETLLGGALASIGRFLRLITTPGPKGAAVVKMGFMVYDLFGQSDRTMPKSRMVGRREFRRAMPDFSRATRYMGEFYDARLTAPERLALELVQDAEAACPDALAVPYVRLVGRSGDAVILADTQTGEQFTVTPETVVNCAGAWVDQADSSLGIAQRLIGGTKGSHLVLRNKDFADKLGDRMIYFETHDHRICLAYPLDAERVLLGTTDIRTDDPEDTVCSNAEIEYLFDVMRAIMPTLALSREQIVFTYAGIRPLPVSEGVAGAISRDHSIRLFEPGPGRPYPVFALVGGKWTTFRPCAEEITDQVLKYLGKTRQRSTLGVAIGGGRGMPTNESDRTALKARLQSKSGLGRDRLEALLDRYGMGAVAMIDRLSGAGETPLKTLPAYTVEELTALAIGERVTTVADVILRRTQIGILGLASAPAITEIAGIVGRALGWSDDRITTDIAVTGHLLATRHGVPAQGAPARATTAPGVPARDGNRESHARAET